MAFAPDRGPQKSQPAVEQPQLTIMEGGLSQSMSTQPEDVLRRATALLDGTAVTLDVASFTQRILNSVKGKSAQEVASLAERYANSTHPVEGAPVPSAEMLQELALTAAILEGHAAEMQNAEAATVQMQTPVTGPTVGMAANTNIETGEPLTMPTTNMEVAANDVITPAPTENTMSAEEPPTVQMEQLSAEEIESMQNQRTELLKTVFGLTAAATLDDARTVATAMRAHADAGKKEKVEAGMAELTSIEARLGNADAHIADAALPEVTTPDADEELPTTMERVLPDAEAPTEQLAAENEAVIQEPNDEAATEVITEQTEDTVESVELGEEGYENTIELEHVREAINADIDANKKMLTRLEERERDLAKQVGKFESLLPKFLLDKGKVKLMETLSDIQIAISHMRAHTNELEADLLEFENAKEVMDVLLEESLKEEKRS